MTTPLFRVPPGDVLGRIGKTHRKVAVIPAEDESLRYIMPVPSGWGRATEISAAPGPNRPELLGLYAPTADLTGPRLMVSVTRLQWDVDPIAWVRQGWLEAGWDIAVARRLPERWCPRFEVGAVIEQGGKYEVRHTVGQVDNGRLLRVDAAAPWKDWYRVRDVMWPCQAYFTLANHTYLRTVEAQTPHGDAHVAFELPASWRAAQARTPVSGSSRWLARPLVGAASVVALRVDATEHSPHGAVPLTERWDTLRRDLRGEGIAMRQKVTRVDKGELWNTPELAGCYRSQAVSGDLRFEVRLVHCEYPGMSVDFTLVVGAVDRHPVEWMRARRGLELAVMSTQDLRRMAPRAG